MRTINTRTILFILLSFCSSVKGFSQTANTDSMNAQVERKHENRRNFTKIVPPIGFINDFEKVFKRKERQSLDSLCTAIEKESTIEIAVVTMDSAFIYKLDSIEGKRMTIDSLTLLLAQGWGIGKKGKDNGILIGFSKRYRKLKIQNGNGTAKILSDSDTKNIIDTIITPEFKRGNYYEGIRKGILALYAKLKPDGTIR